MSWLIMLAHAFNPFLLAIILQQQNEEKTADSNRLAGIFAAVVTSFLCYLFWLGVHWLIMKMAGSSFNFDEFIGVGKGIAYFLPFVLGVVILMIETLILPQLKLEPIQTLVSSLRSIILLFATYFMLINYMAWIAM